MTPNSFTQPSITTGILETWRGPRGAGRVEAGRQSTPWPWPLPADSVLAVFDEPAAVPATLASLHVAGVAADHFWTASGATGAQALRAAFRRRGTLDRLRCLLGSDDEIAAQLVERCARGGSAVLVHGSNGGADVIVEIAARHGARLLRRSGRWLSAWVVPGV